MQCSIARIKELKGQEADKFKEIYNNAIFNNSFIEEAIDFFKYKYGIKDDKLTSLDKGVLYEEILMSSDEHTKIDFASFGENEIDKYIEDDAFTDYLTGESATHLLYFGSDLNQVIGYYVLKASSIIVDNEALPIIEISRLVLKSKYLNENLKIVLLGYLIHKKIYELSKSIGIRGIVIYVDSKEIDLYKKIGYQQLDEKVTIKLVEPGKENYVPMILNMGMEFKYRIVHLISKHSS